MEIFNPLDAKETAALKERFKTVTALRDERAEALTEAETAYKAATEKLTAARQDNMLSESEYEILKKRLEIYGLIEPAQPEEEVDPGICPPLSEVLSNQYTALKEDATPVKPFEHEA